MNRLAALLVLLTASVAHATEDDDIQRVAPTLFGPGVKFNTTMWDGNYVDVLTGTYAVQVASPQMWAEAIGRAVYAATVMERKPGILLIGRDNRDERIFLLRAKLACESIGVRMWYVMLPAKHEQK